MKKNMKKFLSIMLALSLFLGISPIYSYAKNDKYNIEYDNYTDAKKFFEGKGWTWDNDDYSFIKIEDGVKYIVYNTISPHEKLDGTKISKYEVWADKYVGDSEKVVVKGVIDGYQVKSVTNYFARGNKNITEIVFEDGIEYIGLQVVDRCDNLEKITLPETLIMIDSLIVPDNANIRELTFPASLKYLGWMPLYDNKNIETITFEGNAPTIVHRNQATSDQALSLNKTVEINIYEGTTGWDKVFIDVRMGKPSVLEDEFTNIIKQEEKPVDKSKLVVSIDNAKKIDTDNYTDESVKNLNDAVQAAEEVYAKSEPTDEEMKAAMENISTAIDGLIEKPVISDVFKDISDNAWYTEYVQYVYNHHLMEGYEGDFLPDNIITRAMIVQILYNKEGSPEVSDYTACDVLKDVARDEWYTDAVCWAYNTGITTGDTNTMMFNPNASVTREEFATFIGRHAKMNGRSLALRWDINNLLYGSNPSSWAKESFAWCIDKGMISGIKNGDKSDLAPRGTTTRAQAAAIFARYEDPNKYIIHKKY